MNTSPTPSLRASLSAWLARPDCPIANQLCLATSTQRHDEYQFLGITPCLGVSVSDDELVVTVTWQGTLWDMLISLDCKVLASEQGFRCGLCDNGGSLFASATLLFEDHVFQPLLCWVTGDLARASHLHLGGTSGSSTWATLSASSSAPIGTRSLPLRRIPR